jgi:RNA polymerase sigma-70 factor (ECF subfamily)
VLEEQWLRIYRETVHPLYGYTAKRTGGDKALTEDIVQESYLRALDSWKHRAVPDAPLAWLKQVARNILIDFLRRKKWDAKAGPDGPAGVDPRTPADEFESLEVFRAISALGRKKARVLEAFYFDGMSVREIAGEMAVTERAVEGLLRRARGSLRSLLPDPRNNGGKDA